MTTTSQQDQSRPPPYRPTGNNRKEIFHEIR